MTSLEADILSLYETCEMSVDEICSETGCEALSVKAVLGQYSSKFRVATQTPNGGEEVTKDEALEMLSVLKNLAKSSDCDAVRARTAMYVYEESKGRNEARSKAPKVQSAGINILVLNGELRKAREAISRVLEVESSHAVARAKG